jgi:DNA-binding NarL/FixJ family response regulator
MNIRIVLADDHKIVREGLRSLLEREKDIEVVGEAENGKVAVQLTQTLSPDLVLMDISMPEMDGIEATEEIVAKRPDAKVLALSMHSDKWSVEKMLKAGARGYMLKHSASDELVHAIRSVMNDGIYVSSSLTRDD